MTDFKLNKYLILFTSIVFIAVVNIKICYSQAVGNSDNTSSIDFFEERFPYGKLGFNDFINNNLIYPSGAIADSIEGIVYISFILRPSGDISDIKIKEGVRSDLDNECLRVVQLMRWKPQSSNKNLENVNITLPIKFDLSSQSDVNNLSFLLRPNPADKGFTIRIFSSEYEFQYELQDEYGKIIRAGYIITGKTIRVNTVDLDEGKYYFKLFSDAIGIEKHDTLMIER